MAYKDADTKKEYDQTYHAANREKRNAYARQYRKDNYETILNRQRVWCANHKEQISQTKKKYYQKNRERILKQQKQRHYEKRNDPQYKEKHSYYSRKSRQLKRDIVLKHYGGDSPRCVCCGEDTVEFLTLHHTNGDGAAHRRSIGCDLYKWVIEHEYPDDLELLCWNCNLATHQYGKCPHGE